jgi:uncharacterized protein
MYGIFDFHAHVYPDKIAAKAVASVAEFYDLPVVCPGVVPDLLARCAPLGVRGCLVHSAATKPEQVRSANDFIMASCRRYPELVGFGALHRGQGDLEEEFERIVRGGLKGIKLHAEFQGFAIDDEDMAPIYRLAEGRLPILMHMGDEKRDSSSPARLLRVLDRFPGLTVIAAHLGGYRMWKEAAALLSGTGIYFDTCSSLPFLEPDEASGMIRLFGADKVLYGTDYPMWEPAEELARFLRLDLTDAEREAILAGNAARLLGFRLLAREGD